MKLFEVFGKKIAIVLMSIALVGVLSACDSTDYDNAVTKMDSGDYEEAITLFEELGEYEDSEQLLIECKYNLGLAAYESEEWDVAIGYFTDLDYSDSADLLEKSQTQKGMSENADNDFLEALETSITDRMENSGSDDQTSLVNKELAYLSDFENASFYDATLGALALEYIEGVNIQKESLSSEYEYEYQIEWQRGLVIRYSVLTTLYNDYNFMQDNTNFYASYVMEYDDQKALLEAYDALEEDLGSQLNEDTVWYLDYDSYELYYTIKNNTEYKFSTWFDVSYYDEDGVMFESESTYIENIEPGSSYKISFYVENPYRISTFEWSNYYADVYIE